MQDLDSYWGRRWRGRCVCFGSDSAFHIPVWYSELWPQETRPAETCSLLPTLFSRYSLFPLSTSAHLSFFLLSHPSLYFKFQESHVTHTAGPGLYFLSDWNPPAAFWLYLTRVTVNPQHINRLGHAGRPSNATALLHALTSLNSSSFEMNRQLFTLG